MASYLSRKGVIMQGLAELARDLQPEDLTDAEVQPRRDWLVNGSPVRGVSVVDLGEQYDDGTVGTQDIGYLCGLVFAEFDASDSVLPDDKIMHWYEITRRRLADQRSLLLNNDANAPKEHVCIMMPGRTLTNKDKWPNYVIRMLVVAVWYRELPTT